MTLPINTVSVVGLGYIGLPLAVVVASRNVPVIGIDISEKAIDAISGGSAHFFEPDLDAMLETTVRSGKLKVSTTPQKADVFVIAVPTPHHADNSADLSYVESAVKSVAPVLERGNLVIVESTCSVGTTEFVSETLAAARPDLTFPHTVGEDADVHVAYCPERILPGQMMAELVENDRTVGGLSEACTRRATEFYSLFVKGTLHPSNSKTAEFVKLAENAFRDVNIAFANELSLFCDAHGIDVWEAIGLANQHPRVNILQPGPGVGGHCIAVDPWFLVSALPEKTKLMAAARAVNDDKPNFVLDKVAQACERFKHPKVACLGLSYKPDVDDLRESPALEITAAISDFSETDVLVVEPNVEELPAILAGKDNTKLVSLESALAEADIIVVLVSHAEFKRIDTTTLREKVVVDTVGMLR